MRAVGKRGLLPLQLRPVSLDTAAQAFYLCDFYLQNTLPLLELLDEQDKLAGERKVVNILLNKFGGKARHSELMNTCHMNKREFKAAIESLIEREAVAVEAYVNRGITGKVYVLDATIVKSWMD